METTPEIEFLEELKALCRLARKRGNARKARIAIDIEIELDERIARLTPPPAAPAAEQPQHAQAA